MKKARRITRNEEFQDIIKKAPKLTTSTFMIFYRPKLKAENRIGISVSKKSGIAVRRNLIKRQVRMMVDEVGALGLGTDLLIIVRKGYDPSNYDANKKVLESLVKTVKIKEVS